MAAVLLHDLSQRVFSHLQHQAVVIKRTFIEVVDLRAKSDSPRRRYFSDSVVVVSPQNNFTDLAKSDICSTHEESPFCVDTDFSSCEDLVERWQSLSRGRCGEATPAADEPPTTMLEPASTKQRLADEADEVPTKLPPVTDCGCGCSCCGGSRFADEYDVAFDDNTPTNSEGEKGGDGELSWRHLRTMDNFSDSEDEAAPSPPPPLTLEVGPSRTQEVEPPQMFGVEDQRLAQPAAPVVQFLAVLVPTVVEQFGAASVGQTIARRVEDAGVGSAQPAAVRTPVAMQAVAAPSVAVPQPAAVQASVVVQTAVAPSVSVATPSAAAQASVIVQTAVAPSVSVAAPSSVAAAPLPAGIVAPAASVAAPLAATASQAAETASQGRASAAAPRRRTTVMLRNVPNNYTRDRFLALLNRVGLAGLYNFAYLPVDFRTGASLGYAFVNMVDEAAAQRVFNVLDGFNRWSTPSRKRCSVTWNDPQQGLEENVERYRDSPVMHPSVPDECKPVIFSNGVRVPYPEATRAIKPPRIRKLA